VYQCQEERRDNRGTEQRPTGIDLLYDHVLSLWQGHLVGELKKMRARGDQAKCNADDREQTRPFERNDILREHVQLLSSGPDRYNSLTAAGRRGSASIPSLRGIDRGRWFCTAAHLHNGISPRTVEFHRANIMQKLGARNTADLVRRVLGE
jgi:hypothetical protein